MFMNRPGAGPVLSAQTAGGGGTRRGPGDAGASSAKPVDLPASPIAPEGIPIVISFLVISALLTWAAVWFLGIWGVIIGVITGALSLWCIWFFRDPKRSIPGAQSNKLPIISPADGVVCFVGCVAPPPELGLTEDQTKGLTRVSVFMNVFNVHVNRAPLAGTVEKSVYKPGKFFNASFDKASELNERHSLILRSDAGIRLICVQIAGLIARRIVCRVKEGEHLQPAQRYGLIRFGSRVDVYVPAGITPLVKVGDPTVAGETVLAWLDPSASPSTKTGG
jgi:phosphatidylserine decarboxylase